MPEYSPQQVDYAKYRLERSQEDLQCAEKLFDDGHFRAANNRAYYAIFHAIRVKVNIKLLFFGGVKCRFWANQSSPYHQTAACL